MKLSTCVTAALVAISLAGIAPTAGAQTLKKVADSNKITVSYREEIGRASCREEC